MNTKQARGVIARIERMRVLMQDGKERNRTQIAEAIGCTTDDTNLVIQKMIYHNELIMSRIGKKNVRFYQSTRFLGHGIKLNELTDAELPTPEGVLMLQDIVMKQRALRLAGVRHG